MGVEPLGMDSGTVNALRKTYSLPRVVALTGAGISAPSGVPTFRGKEGLWRQYDPQQLATPEAFARDPKLVWEWYDWRRQRIAACEPNAAHYTLVDMERTLPPGHMAIITQNVDGLHQKAGSRNLLPLHGDIWSVRCMECGYRGEDRRVPLPEIPPHCPHCGGLLRPDVVWFGEALPYAVLNQAFAVVQAADYMLVIGTSAVVQPAASLATVAQRHGARLIVFNIEPTPLSDLADEEILGSVDETLPTWWAQTAARWGVSK